MNFKFYICILPEIYYQFKIFLKSLLYFDVSEMAQIILELEQRREAEVRSAQSWSREVKKRQGRK